MNNTKKICADCTFCKRRGNGEFYCIEQGDCFEIRAVNDASNCRDFRHKCA